MVSELTIATYSPSGVGYGPLAKCILSSSTPAHDDLGCATSGSCRSTQSSPPNTSDFNSTSSGPSSCRALVRSFLPQNGTGSRHSLAREPATVAEKSWHDRSCHTCCLRLPPQTRRSASCGIWTNRRSRVRKRAVPERLNAVATWTASVHSIASCWPSGIRT